MREARRPEPKMGPRVTGRDPDANGWLKEFAQNIYILVGTRSVFPAGCNTLGCYPAVVFFIAPSPRSQAHYPHFRNEEVSKGRCCVLNKVSGEASSTSQPSRSSQPRGLPTRALRIHPGSEPGLLTTSRLPCSSLTHELPAKPVCR